MTLAQYIRSKGYKLTIRRLAVLSNYTPAGLWGMYNRDPTKIDALLSQYDEQIRRGGVDKELS